MKTVPFSDILSGVCQLVGLDKNTLNDKSFAAVRDLTSRRINIIWDREEWPDANRTLRAFPGNPITRVEAIGNVILTENNIDILQEDGAVITTEDAPDTVMPIQIFLDTTFPRIYLADFEDDAYRKDTIQDTYVKITNSFYYTDNAGNLHNLGEGTYKFSYNTAVGSAGEYITDIQITTQAGIISYPTYGGPNHSLTSKLIFLSNKNYIVALEDNALHGLSATSGDTRETTRVQNERFIVEDFSDKNDIPVGGTALVQENSYLRFFNDAVKFITYRKSAPRLYGFAYNMVNSYQPGAQVFYDQYQSSSSYNPASVNLAVNGNFWNAVITANPGTAPANSSLNWQEVEIPYRFRNYLINGTAADFMRAEGRADEANIFDQLAESDVQQQIDVLLRQQGQVQRMNMVYTY